MGHLNPDLIQIADVYLCIGFFISILVRIIGRQRIQLMDYLIFILAWPIFLCALVLDKLGVLLHDIYI